MHGIDRSVPLFFTRVRGTHIPATLQLVVDVLRVPRIAFPNYPSCERLWTISKDQLLFASALLIEVIISLHHVGLLLKVLDS